MNNLIFENENLDDLQINNLYLIQKQSGFKFGTDAVLLSDFAKAEKAERMLDLCTGSGVIPILLSAKTTAKYIAGIEIQEDIADMARRSVEYNGLKDRIEIINGDLKNSREYFEPHSFDSITINPPYMKAQANIKNIADSKTIARHEVACTLEECMTACADMLKFRGSLFMIHRPKRLIDIIYAMRNACIEPRLIRLVYPKPEREPSMLLVKGVYKGGCELKIMPPLYIKDEDGNDTEEIKKIYGRDK